MDHDSIMAAWHAHTYRSEQEAAEQAPDAEAEQWARAQYQRGAEILKTYTVWASGRFSMGADPYGTLLEGFIAKREIVHWTETFAGYVATAEQRCYIGLARR